MAEDRKALETELQQLNSDRSKLSEQLATLEAMIQVDQKSDEELAEMREYDPENYIKHMERQQKTQELLKSTKADAKPKFNAQEENAKLIKANPQWLDSNGKATEVYQDDMSSLTNYYTTAGFTQDEVDLLNTSAKFSQMALDAARNKATAAKKAVVEKRVRRAPTSTRPKNQSTNAGNREIKALQAKARAR